MNTRIFLGLFMAVVYAISSVTYADEYSEFWEDMFSEDEWEWEWEYSDDGFENEGSEVDEPGNNNSTAGNVENSPSDNSTVEIVVGDKATNGSQSNPSSVEVVVGDKATDGSQSNPSTVNIVVGDKATDDSQSNPSTVNIVVGDKATDGSQSNPSTVNIVVGDKATDGSQSNPSTVDIVVKDRKPSNYYPALNDPDSPKQTEYHFKTNPGKQLKDIDISENYDPANNDKITLNPSANSRVKIYRKRRILTYRPKRGFIGIDVFTYAVTKTHGKTYVFTIHVEVREHSEENVNFAINFYEEGDIIASGSIAIINISANFDPSQHKLTLEHSTNGRVIENKDGTLVYFSKLTFFGVDVFSYIVEEPSGNKERFKVEVKVAKNRKLIPKADCQVYFVHDEGISDSQFLTIDPLAKEKRNANPIGPMYKGIDIEGMATHPDTKVVYAVSGLTSLIGKALNGFLYIVNPQTGGLNVVGDTGYSQLTGLAFDPDGTFLLGWTARGAKEYRSEKDQPGKSGLILINTQTAESVLVYSPFWPNQHISPRWPKGHEVGGIAWDSVNPYTVYLTKDKGLWKLTYDGEKFNLLKSCALPGTVEALETLKNGFLMFALHNDGGNCLYVYNPDKCEIVEAHSFTTTLRYSDVEAIVWPSCGNRDQIDGKKLPPSNSSSCDCKGVKRKQCK